MKNHRERDCQNCNSGRHNSRMNVNTIAQTMSKIQISRDVCFLFIVQHIEKENCQKSTKAFLVSCSYVLTRIPLVRLHIFHDLLYSFRGLVFHWNNERILGDYYIENLVLCLTIILFLYDLLYDFLGFSNMLQSVSSIDANQLIVAYCCFIRSRALKHIHSGFRTVCISMICG